MKVIVDKIRVLFCFDKIVRFLLHSKYMFSCSAAICRFVYCMHVMFSMKIFISYLSLSTVGVNDVEEIMSLLLMTYKELLFIALQLHLYGKRSTC